MALTIVRHIMERKYELYILLPRVKLQTTDKTVAFIKR